MDDLGDGPVGSKPGPTQGPLLTPGRRLVLRVGLACMALGFLLFFSTFVSFALHFGDFDHFEERTRSQALRAVGGLGLVLVGMGLTIGSTVGQTMRWLGDPERAARELAPWARLSGRLQDEAFREMTTVRATVSDLASGRTREEPAPAPAPATPLIQVRCRACGGLSDESARFCSGCGAAL